MSPLVAPRIIGPGNTVRTHSARYSPCGGPRRLIRLLLALTLAWPAPSEPRLTVDVAPDWRFVTGGRIRVPPAIAADGTIYCASEDRLLRAVSGEGRELWRLALGSRPAASPLVRPDGCICIVTADGLLRCVGPQGRARWSRELPASLVAAPAEGRDGSLYLPLESGLLLAVDYVGRERWSFRFKAEIVSSPSVGRDGTVYLSTSDRLFHAVGGDGEQLWTVALAGAGGSAALGSTGRIYVSSFGVHAFSPKGELQWELPVPYPTTDAVVAPDPSGRSEEMVLVAARNGTLHAMDAEGTRLEEIELGGSILTAPAIRSDGAAIVATSQGLCRVRLSRTGEPAAVTRARGELASPVLTASGVAIAGSEDWVLYACSFGDAASSRAGRDPAPFWPLPRHDAAQTGLAGEAAGSGTAYLLLSELVSSPFPSQKEEVLAEIRAHLDGERYLPLTAGQMEGILVFLSQEGAQSPIYVGEQGLTDYPRLRATACELLGELGTEGARRALIAAVQKDPRGEVQSRAAWALGRVGYDPDGRAGRALQRLAERRRADEGLLLVVVRSLGELAAAAGPTLGLGDAAVAADETSPEGRPSWEALISLAAGEYPERVRAAARAALQELLRALRL